MATRVFPSIPNDYAAFCEDKSLSYSALLQDAIEERADEHGVELEGY